MSTDLMTKQETLPVTADKANALGDSNPEWQQILREAEKLAAAPLTPVHLKVFPNDLPAVPEEDRRRVAWQQTVANCILVANQAHRWHADVFAVAAETYVVGNKLGYQGKLIAAVVNARGDLDKPLQVLYSTDKGDKLAAVIYGKRDGVVPSEAYPFLESYADKEDRDALRKLARIGVLAIRISVGQAKTTNKMWTNDPEQKLWYTGATKWARRFAPELMLGILSDEDLRCMQESETGVNPEATKSRIAMVIPASLDASGVTQPQDNAPQAEEMAEALDTIEEGDTMGLTPEEVAAKEQIAGMTEEGDPSLPDDERLF